MPTDPALGLPMVYLVDDEDVVRDALGWLLRSRRLLSEGFASADAFEAWLATQRAPRQPPWPLAPSCLVLDMRMPGTSGLVLFERLAEAGLLPLLPVIFLTGHGDVPTAVSAVKRGAFDFVQHIVRHQVFLVRLLRPRRPQLGGRLLGVDGSECRDRPDLGGTMRFHPTQPLSQEGFVDACNR